MTRIARLASSALAATLALACRDSRDSAPPAPAPPVAASAAPRPAFDPSVLGALAPLPKSADGASPASAERVLLGRMLYADLRLSKNHDVSCDSCHKLGAFGVDGEATSVGHKKQRGGRNAPTVLNAALHFRQFWDGRAVDVEEQATGPIQNPIEMASSERRAVAVLASMPEYVAAFERAFPGEKAPITLKNVGVAIGAFERKLLTPSRFDRYLAGDRSAMTEAELAGAALFVRTGCTVCHAGPLLGGQSYQKVGAVTPWPNQKDQGVFELTKADADRLKFKVPSLRNVEKTGPYFHDGATAKLGDAVRLMARHQLGRELHDSEIDSIVTFLGALTAPTPADLATPPALPKSTPKTPKPDPT